MKTRSLISFIVGVTLFGLGNFPTHAQKQEKNERILSPRGVKQINRTQSIQSETSRNLLLEKVILRSNPEYVEVARKLPQYPRYYYNKIDLNGDNRLDIIVHFEGPYFCGTGGCTTQIFKNVGQDYRLVSRIDVSSPPIIVTKNKTLGWNDLIVSASSGGGRTSASTSGYYLLRFNGREYPASPDEGIKLSRNSNMTGIALFSNSRKTNRGFVLQPRIISLTETGRSLRC